MLRKLRKAALAAGLTALSLGFAADGLAAANKPTPAQALGLHPMQPGVDIDQPAKGEVEKCTLVAEKEKGLSGWVLQTESGRILRRFIDTNGDNRVDQWCYFKDGVEIYRDIDSNQNGKADQYRWLGTAGIRWGLDPDEDGKIDSWKMISPEEATAEVVAAFRDKDAARFERLLLTSAELKALGLGEQRLKQISAKVAAAKDEFKNISKQQQVIGPKSEWVHFGGTQPGILPAGSEGATKDIVVYDNVSAVVESDEKHAQVAIGTLFRVGETWRIIDVPSNLLDAQANAKPSEPFFYAGAGAEAENVAPEASGLSKKTQELITELAGIEKAITTASETQLPKWHAKRCDVLEGLIDSAKPGEDKTNWIRQYADTVAAAVQAEVFPEGAKRLDSLSQVVAKTTDADLHAFVKFRAMSAAYNVSTQQEKPEYPKIQAKWKADLAKFIDEFARSPDAAEALLQLALALESEGNDEEAAANYGRIVGEFGSTPLAKKAAGARKRLNCVGKSIDLKGRTLEGKPIDLQSSAGKMVVIHYWSTWCGPCKNDMVMLKQLQAKFANRPLQIIGVNLDNKGADAAAYLKTNSFPWPHLYEEGGLDGRLATELGIWTLPTMILLDKEGKVVNRDIHIGELEMELDKRLK